MSFSLQASLQTCKVDQSMANRYQSDRIFNPNIMVCPPFNGYDLTGREVCVDSFYTKNEGCNSAEDRVMVENFLRPNYMEYLTLDANGIQGNLYSDNMFHNDAMARTGTRVKDQKISGNYGSDFMANTTSTCKGDRYDMAMAQMSQNNRQNVMSRGSQKASYYGCASGNCS